VIDAAAGCLWWPSGALHFHPYRIASVDSVRIEFNSHGILVEIVQKDFNFKHVVVRAGFNPKVAEA
jgi:hypothetical protein